jgi:hypothetical protein
MANVFHGCEARRSRRFHLLRPQRLGRERHCADPVADAMSRDHGRLQRIQKARPLPCLL